MAVLTDDGNVWPEDQPAGPPAPTNPPADPYGGYWIPRILAGLYNTAKSGINLTGDVAYGQASPSDPDFASRVGDMASTALMLPSLAAGGQQPTHLSRRDCDHVAGRRLAEGRVAADTGKPVRHVA
jgi:hypothetical protein